MNIYEAARIGKPFAHPDMIGAYMICGDYLVHRDNVSDFNNNAFISKHCLGIEVLHLMTVSDLLRTDWYVYDEY